MPGKLDTSLTAVAERLIRDFGKESVYTNTVQTPPSEQDIIEGNLQGSVIKTQYDVVISPPSPYKESLIDGEMIRYGDASALIQGQDLAFVPTLMDVVAIDDVDYKVLDVTKLYSGRLVAAYELQLRASKGL